MGLFWAEQAIKRRLEQILHSSFADVVTFAAARKTTNRMAAYMLAIDRVASTIRQRGIYG
jgi:glutamate dehydrogenase (NAD(P)+)